MNKPAVSVVVSTYNRARVLAQAIENLLNQSIARERYEMIIVDNNSSDETREVVTAFCERAPTVRYVFEPRQGVSYGRNAGIRLAQAPLVAFTDDDVYVAANWLEIILHVFASHPEVACIGGRVLPARSGPWPSWLTRDHWSPLALVDYGDKPLYVNSGKRLCLITANAAYRRQVFDVIGMFAPHVQAVGRDVATEDHEILLRLWRTGQQGLYCPDLIATTDTPPERLRRAYHRRWHRRHGCFSAIMRDEELERSRMGCFFGVPAHLYRRAATDLVLWARDTLRGKTVEAFTHEVRVLFCIGFFTARWREFFSRRRPT